MNRKPRTEAELYRWHTDTLAHIAAHGEKDRNRPRVSENSPEAGWFMRRVEKNGAYVPCRIWVEWDMDENGDLAGPERWFCEVDGARRDVSREWTWLCARPITEDKYMDMLTGAFAQPRDNSPLFSEPAPAPVPEAARGEPLQTDDLPEAQPEPEQTGAVKTMF